MKRKIVWVVVSCLMALSLLMASCAPAVTEEEEVAPPVEEEVVTEEEVAPALEGPQYGGVIRLMAGKGFQGFDPGFAPLSLHLSLCMEELLTGDWAKGPAGTNEFSFTTGGYFTPKAETGLLAESWETPEAGTIIYHIRQGIHWHDKPPVNGRELTAEDVVFGLKYLLAARWSFLRDHHNPDDVYSVEAPDKWTVVVKCNPKAARSLFMDLSDGAQIVPPEVVEQYGDMSDWRNVCGTGPFLLVDHVSDSSAKFVRNPNYWRSDPLHPENILPYVDGIDALVIPDPSTTRAALRVGKIDTCGVSWEEAPIMWETSPELKWMKRPGYGKGTVYCMRIDKPELPFQDIRVRRALALAINNQEIVDDFYEGNAEMFAWPINPVQDYSDMYTPLEEFDEEIRELYEYHPDKARQLLAEAGYPDGFKTAIACGAGDVDPLSIVVEYWAKIGVELELDVTEESILRSKINSLAYDMCTFKSPTAMPTHLADTKVGSIINRSMIDDPYIEELYYRIQENLYTPEASRLVKEEYVPYLLKNCWYIPFPSPSGYFFWQPWLMDYHGERGLGRVNGSNWTIYVWIDQELKREMLGR